jgi:hypothetical protein
MEITDDCSADSVVPASLISFIQMVTGQNEPTAITAALFWFYGRHVCGCFCLYLPVGFQHPPSFSRGLTTGGNGINILGLVRISPYFYRHKTKRYVE